MKPVGKIILKTLYTLGLCLLVVVSCFAQPEVKNLDRAKGSMEQTVILKGSGFGTDATKLSVTFGASRADIESVTDQILQVKVPFGTTYDNISVSNTTTGLTGYSREQFLLSFSGTPGFDIAKLQGQFNFPAAATASEGMYDLCMCDFDGDRKIDVATANDASSFINIYQNTSTGPGNVNFGVKYAINILSGTLQIKCGDLNGDGKPDLVATESGTNDKVFILRNTSTGAGNFTFSSQSVTLTNKRPKRIEIADLDLDGKPEIILTTQGNNAVTILKNQSTTAAVLFSATPTDVTIPGAVSTDGLAVEDLNGDLLPEIVTSQYQINTNVFVISNKSVPGSLNLTHELTIPVGTTVKNIRIGDLDGDGKADLAFTQLTPQPLLNLVRNQSSPAALAFGALSTIETDVFPWGLDFGDLDGDGKTDIVVASITNKSLTILNNNSTAGSFNFQRVLKTGLTYLTRHVVVSDVDSDGKPDITFTSNDNSTSKVSVLRNSTCMVPEVTPPGPHNVCSSFPVTLTGTKGGGVTYEWINNTTSTTTPGTNVLTPAVSGDYQVRATSEGGSCTPLSNTVSVTISPGTAGDPDPANNGPVCTGSTLTLTLNNNLGVGFTYKWSGPDGFSATGATATRTGVQLKDAGEYFVDVISSSGCVARREPTVVTVIDVPDFRVGFTGSEIICQGDPPKTLTVAPNSPNYTYQWFETSDGDLGVSGTSHFVTTTGEYYVKATATTPGCSDVFSEKATITVASVPVAAFSAPGTACKGQEVTFNNQSTSDPATTAFYSWTFGDGNTSTQEEPKHIYTTAATRTVTLTISYKNGACPSSVPHSITITDAPTISITNDDNLYDLCPGASLPLEVTSTGTFTSYTWSTGETGPSITIDEPGNYTVDALESGGCILKAVRVIGENPAPVINVTATPEIINEGESAQLNADGLQDYSWTPLESLNDATLSNPIATPLASTVYSVTGTDINGCTGTATVELRVKGEAIVTKLAPGNFFSPNGDEIQPYWMIGKIDEYPQCGVVIYDDKGVKVFDAKPYMNDWDGTFNGRKLPDGVYYYVIRCDGEENQPRMGSITILR